MAIRVAPIGVMLFTLVCGTACSSSSHHASTPTSATSIPASSTTELMTRRHTTQTTRPGVSVTGKERNALRGLADYVSNAYSYHVPDGLQALASANYYVYAHKYDAQACIAEWTKTNGNTTTVRLVVRPGTVKRAADYSDPLVGRPAGTVYSLRGDLTLFDPTTNVRTTTNVPFHAVILPDGNGKLFVDCTSGIVNLR